MKPLFALLLLCTPAFAADEPGCGRFHRWADLVERNICVRDTGEVWLDQLIFRSTQPYEEILDWRYTDGKTFDRPAINRLVIYWLEDDGMIFSVTTPIYYETWTNYDAEVREREQLPERERRTIR